MIYNIKSFSPFILISWSILQNLIMLKRKSILLHLFVLYIVALSKSVEELKSVVANLSTEHSRTFILSLCSRKQKLIRTKVWRQLTSNPAGFVPMFSPEVGPLIMSQMIRIKAL